MARQHDRQAPRHPGPIGGGMAAVLWGIARRLQLPSLEARHSQVAILGLFALVNGIISIALMAMAALVTGAPFIFPSLGPTAFLLFYTPTQPAASPRNALGGHLIGALAGYLALVAFGLTERGPALATGVDWANVGAAALSLGLTSGGMVWFKVPHPPAGATTLIVSLGILREPWQLAVLMLAVALLVVQGLVINRLAGIDYPLWAPRAAPVRDPAVAPGTAAAPPSRLSEDAAPHGHGNST
jgi:CBS-domain-containing membrane protein